MKILLWNFKFQNFNYIIVNRQNNWHIRILGNFAECNPTQTKFVKFESNPNIVIY